jgi:hypothetical protein
LFSIFYISFQSVFVLSEYRVAAQATRESGVDNFDPAASVLTKSGADDPIPATAVPPESEFGGLVSYFSSQQEDFEES